MNKKSLLIYIFTLVLIFSFSQAAMAREITPSTATTLEQLQEETMALVEAAKGQEDKMVQAEAAIVVEPITKNVIFEKNADATMYPASTTKIMSFVVALESVNRGEHTMDDQVTISPQVEAMTEGDIGLKAGEVYRLGDLLLAMSIISANDAALAVAEYIGGSEPQFVEMMNAKAAELGMANTNYVNCCGLHDDNHYTTARDLATLSIYSVDVPGLLELTSNPGYTFPLASGPKVITNTNRTLFWYPGADGLKTGFTTPAGYCLSATAVKDDLRLISVVTGCNVQYQHYGEAMKLLNYGFDHCAFGEAVTAGEFSDTVYLPKGRVEEVNVTAADTIVLPTLTGNDPGYEIECHRDENVKAPVNNRDIIGKIVITANGEILGETDMVATNSVAEETIFQTAVRFFRDIIRQISD